MATSGIIQTSTYTWTAGDGNKKSIYYTAEWERTAYSIVDNTSTVKFTIKAVKSTSTWGVNEKKIKLTLDGEEIYYRGGTVSRKASATVAEVTRVINHNADGNKSFALYLELAVGGSDNPNKSAGGSFSLDWIPRQSPIGSSTAEVVVNGTNRHTISWTPYVSSYSHKATWSIGSYSSTQTIAAGTNSASLAIPKDWLRAIPSATSGTATVKLETYSGSTLIGSAQSKTFVIKTAGSETPNCSISASDANGYYGKIAAYIINQSKIMVDVSGITYQYGASLKSIAVTIGTTTYTGTATSVTAQSNINAASTAVKVVLTDSRGYTVTKTLTVTAYAYVLPALSLSINRYHNNNGTYEHDDEGEYGRVVYTASITQIGSNALQNVKIDWVASDGSGSGTRTLTTMDGDIYVACDTEKVFTFTLTVTDKLNTVVYRKQLSSAVTIMDIIAGGDGVCFGGVATHHEQFDIRWPVALHGGIVTDKRLGENVDFNNITEVGVYGCASDTTFQTMANKPPTTNAGTLYVINAFAQPVLRPTLGTYCYFVQLYIDWTGRLFSRYLWSNPAGTNSFGQWRSFSYT